MLMAAKAPGCLVVPGLALEGEAGRAALLVMARKHEVQLFFSEYESSRAADVIVVGDAAVGLAASPAFHVFASPSPNVIEGADVDTVSRLLSITYDGVSRNQSGVLPDNPPGMKEMLQAIQSERPTPEHPLLALLAGGPGRPGDSAHLPLTMFALDRRHSADGRVPWRLGLAGRARYLLYGAYHWLPRGTWRATIIFSVDRDASNQHFRIEWGSVKDFSHHNFRPSDAGRYSIAIDATLQNADQVELRLILANSSLSGEIELTDVILERVN
ncbi:hypothetical protein ABIC32_001912 [Brevundimonas sp. 1080]